MAVVIPQVITEDRAAAASHVTGSFQFPDRNGHHKLTYWPQSDGDKLFYTVSMWVKNSMPDASGQNPLWSASPATDNNSYFGLYLGSDCLRYHNGNPSNALITNAADGYKLRDPNSWYHIHTIVSSQGGTVYVNGEQWGNSNFSLNTQWWNNTSYRMDIGSHAVNGGVTGSVYAGYQFAEVYHVDGACLDAEVFGYTDSATGVWTPRKYVPVNTGVSWGNNGQLATNGSWLTSSDGTNLFDRSDTGRDVAERTGGVYIEWTPTSPIQAKKISCKSHNNFGGGVHGTSGQWTVNGNITVPTTGNDSYDILYEGPSIEVTSIKYEVFNSAVNTYAYWNSIKINDQLLVSSNNGWGTNGFYLPMDGKTPINEDQSPNGHNFITTNYTTTAGQASGSLSNQTTLDKATGAIPIMRTDPSGQVVIGGPRTHRITYKVTVQDDGGNKYFLNGTRYSPGTIPMYRGGIYKFDQSDASNATHPLRFATAADAAGSTEYTDGVTQTGTPGQAGAYTLIVVPHNAPDTLHYYCTNHGGMGGPTANTTDIHVADPYAWKLQLALPFCARNTTPANRINDGINYTNADKPDTLNPLQTANTSLNTGIFPTPNPKESIFYGGAMRFSGGNSGGQYVLYSTSTVTAAETMAFGTGDFTVECWAKFNNTGGSGTSAIMSTSTTSQNSGSWIFGFDNGGNFGWCYDVPAPNFSWASTKIDGYFNTWHHYAVTRKSGVIKMFIDGVQMFKFTDNTNYNYASSTPKIGQRWTNQNAYSIDGELQDLRVYKGVAKYGDNTNYNRDPAFLCGTTKPYFLPEVPKGTPYPGTLKKITGGSVYFNGGNNGVDRLMVANHSDFDLGTDDWTIELYFFVDENVRNYGVVLGKNGPTFQLADSSFYMNIGNGGTNNVAFNYVDGTTNANWRGVYSEYYRLRFYEWNHVAVTKKGTEISIFVNGLLEATNTVPAVSAVKATTSPISIGSPYEYVGSASDYSYRGYISNVRIVKGTAVYEDDFVPTFEPLEAINGTVLLCCNSSTSPTEAVVSPTALTTNGTVGATNFSPFIDNLLQMQGPENNYAVLEATKIKTHSREVVEGLSITGDLSSAWNSFPGTMGASSGKWYWEVYDRDGYFGIVAGAAQDGSFHMWDTDVYVGQSSYGNSWGIMNNGTLYVNGTQTGSYFPAFAGSSIQYSTLGFALDMDSGKAYISLDGRWGSDAAPHTNAQISDGSATPAVSGLTGTYRPVISVDGGTTNTRRLDVNFGQRPFRFPPPEGYKCWNRTNMPTPEKAAWNSTKYFVPYIWSGTQSGTAGATTNKEIGFEPDLVWVTQRNQAYSRAFQIYDSLRGFGDEKELDTTVNNNEGDGNCEQYGYLTGNYANGFTVRGGTVDYDYVNKTGVNYIAWCWKAGGSSSTYNVDGIGYSTASAAGLDGGTHTGVIGQSVGTKQGFAMIKYNGTSANQTIKHGLSKTPEMIIIKDYANGQSWTVFHKDMPTPADKFLNLSSNNNGSTYAAILNSTLPTSSFITLGTDAYSNSSTSYISYVFHSVEGYSKTGKYIGNGHSNGPVVYLDFEPSFILFKRISGGTGNWMCLDNKRRTYEGNPIGRSKAWNLSAQEAYAYTNYVDFLSNGFKIRNDDSNFNAGGSEYIYLAFAEAPTNAGFGAVVNAR